MTLQPVAVITYLPDGAAVFASALSLWQACQKRALGEEPFNLSDYYSGIDQFMREVMRVANHFEAWACLHINFYELTESWPSLLEDRFGKACLEVIPPSALAQFEDRACLRVAIRLRLPITPDDNLPVPIDVTAPNPVDRAVFRKFRIRTMRDSIEGDDSAPFVPEDDPFDEGFGAPYFSLYGVGDDQLLEHIADRRTYSKAVSLARKLAPGVLFPPAPPFSAAAPPAPNTANR